MSPCLHLKECMTDKLVYSDLGIWQMFPQKQINKGNNWQSLLPMVKIPAKTRILEICIYHHEFDNFPIHIDFSDEPTGDANKNDFYDVVE